MKKDYSYSKLQMTALVILRLAVGWQILYEGLAKLLNPAWTSADFMGQSKWILSGFANWIISNQGVLSAVDFLNTWGLIAIGLGLMFGLFSRIAAIAGAILVFVYYLNAPPLIGLEYALPTDGNNLIVNKTLIESIALCVLALFPTSKIFGLDAFWSKTISKEKEEE